jgi:hypothetical protein
LLGRAELRAVQLGPLGLTGLEDDLELERNGATLAPKADATGRGAEADELRVRPRARREALRPDVQGLEQVRLSRSVGPDGEYEPRLEVQLERRIRAEVAKRDRADDQP